MRAIRGVNFIYDYLFRISPTLLLLDQTGMQFDEIHLPKAAREWSKGMTDAALALMLVPFYFLLAELMPADSLSCDADKTAAFGSCFVAT